MASTSNATNMKIVDQTQLNSYIDTQKNSFYALQGRVSWSTVSILAGALALAFTSRISGLIIGSLTRMSQNVAVSPKALDAATNYLTTKNITLAGKVLLGFGVFLMKWEARQTNNAAEKAFTAIKTELTTSSKEFVDLEKLTALFGLLGLNGDVTLEQITAAVTQKIEDAKVRVALLAELPRDTAGTGKDGAISDRDIVAFVQELKAKKDELLNLRRDVLEQARKAPGSTLAVTDVKDDQIIAVLTDLCAKHQAVVDALVAGEKAKASGSSSGFDAVAAAKALVEERQNLRTFKEGVVTAIAQVDKSITASSALDSITAAIGKVVKLVQDLSGYKTAVETKFKLTATDDIGTDTAAMQKVETNGTLNQENQEFREVIVTHLYGDEVADISTITAEQVIGKIKAPGILKGIGSVWSSIRSPVKGSQDQD